MKCLLIMRIIRHGRKKYKTCITNYNSQQYCELLVWIDVKKAQDAVDYNWLRERMAYHRFAKWIGGVVHGIFEEKLKVIRDI